MSLAGAIGKLEKDAAFRDKFFPFFGSAYNLRLVALLSAQVHQPLGELSRRGLDVNERQVLIVAENC